MSPFLALGHSHIVALARGFDLLVHDGALAFETAVKCGFHYLHAGEFRPNLTREGREDALHPAIGDLLARYEPLPVILAVGGNEHNVLSILEAEPKYDFILAERPDLPLAAVAEIYPEAMAREILRDWMDDGLRLLRAIRAASRSPMAQMSPPPPLPKSHVLAFPGDLLSDPAAGDRIAADALRFKMWRLACGLYRETCREAGVAFIEAPSDATDANGMMCELYRGGDPTHANDKFGRRMLEAAFAIFSGGNWG